MASSKYVYFYVSGSGFGARVYENQAASQEQAREYVASTCREAAILSSTDWNEDEKHNWKVTGPHHASGD
jgi:hypothetical protein